MNQEVLPCADIVSSHLWLHWTAAGLYAIGLYYLRRSYKAQSWTTARKLAVALIVCPAAYYPIAYFLLKWTPLGGHEYVQVLAELWGPLWAALSAIWGYILVEKIDKSDTKRPSRS